MFLTLRLGNFKTNLKAHSILTVQMTTQGKINRTPDYCSLGRDRESEGHHMANGDQSLIHGVCLDNSPISLKGVTGGIGLFSDIIPLGVKIDLAQQYFNSGPCGVETP